MPFARSRAFLWAVPAAAVLPTGLSETALILLAIVLVTLIVALVVLIIALVKGHLPRVQWGTFRLEFRSVDVYSDAKDER